MLAVIFYFHYIDRNKLLKLIISIFCSLYVCMKLNLTIIVEKCPKCYGTEMCHYFQNHQIQLTYLSFLTSILNPKLSKSVFHAFYNSEKVVLKRKSVRVQKSILELSFKNLINYILQNESTALIPQNVILCPGFASFHSLFSQVKSNVTQEKLWFNLDSSIEPLLLLYFESHKKWLAPKYLGSCGDVIVVENKGVPLSSFASSNFKIRGFLAIKLLQMAYSFTFEDPNFSFYFTDISQDNFVVDSHGNVSLIDLDNVIIFDRKNNKEKIFNKIHINNFHGDQYGFSPWEICDHDLSDFNYYSVCVHLLMEPKMGLLLQIPKKFLTSNLIELLKECRKPNKYNNFIVVGQKLQNLLEIITKDFKWES